FELFTASDESLSITLQSHFRSHYTKTSSTSSVEHVDEQDEALLYRTLVMDLVAWEVTTGFVQESIAPAFRNVVKLEATTAFTLFQALLPISKAIEECSNDSKGTGMHRGAAWFLVHSLLLPLLEMIPAALVLSEKLIQDCSLSAMVSMAEVIVRREEQRSTNTSSVAARLQRALAEQGESIRETSLGYLEFAEKV
ncbi:unnamed protein product, partial [Amoebophrya sp. A25]